MRTLKFLPYIAFLAMASGCHSPVTGTWRADHTGGVDDNPIANATFCHDGTFLATAQYGDKSRATPGHYEVDDGMLELDIEGHTRAYIVNVDGDEMTLTHSGKTYKMLRMKPRD
ncbi:MAG: hypothetical protein MI923_29590 [Phycisphaerales bacterium]|nr:hypothetical protein [Phycisphaerales bacterium]